MQERMFAAWVEPIAALYRERREELIAFAQAATAESWARYARESGWTCKDVLAHVAGDTGQNLQTALQAIVEGRRVPEWLFTDFDARNERDVQERRDRSIADLIGELRSAGEETQRLLSLLSDADEHRTEHGLRGALPDALRALATHDATHLAQLQEALEPSRAETA